MHCRVTMQSNKLFAYNKTLLLCLGGLFMERRTISVAETAIVLGVSRPTVYKMIQDGGFQAVKLRRRTVIPIVELDEWIRAQSQKALCATN